VADTRPTPASHVSPEAPKTSSRLSRISSGDMEFLLPHIAVDDSLWPLGVGDGMERSASSVYNVSSIDSRTPSPHGNGRFSFQPDDDAKVLQAKTSGESGLWERPRRVRVPSQLYSSPPSAMSAVPEPLRPKGGDPALVHIELAATEADRAPGIGAVGI
jgi:hypothetical protein